jgi:hypothetical protein
MMANGKQIFPVLLLLLIASASGCEVGRSWFSMSSDSPSPWFGFDLLPRRKTTNLTLPRPGDDGSPRERTAKPALYQASDRSTTGRTFSKELHLPPVSAFFDSEEDVEISFTGPKSTFSR